MAASRVAQMRFLARPDYAKCVIAQKTAAARQKIAGLYAAPLT
jgi:hypothetical protein